MMPRIKPLLVLCAALLTVTPAALPGGRQNGTSGACRLPAGRDSGA